MVVWSPLGASDAPRRQGSYLPGFFRDAAFGTYVPNDQGDLKTTKERPEVACVACVGPGGSITTSYAAEIKPIAAKVAENDHFPC